MATKFFTNSGENTLLNKFDGIFKNTSVHYFDALVGYFRSSGYFQIRNYLKNVEQIRILVGIDVDHLISEAARKGQSLILIPRLLEKNSLESLKKIFNKLPIKKR